MKNSSRKFKFEKSAIIESLVAALLFFAFISLLGREWSYRVISVLFIGGSWLYVTWKELIHYNSISNAQTQLNHQIILHNSNKNALELGVNLDIERSRENLKEAQNSLEKAKYKKEMRDRISLICRLLSLVGAMVIFTSDSIESMVQYFFSDPTMTNNENVIGANSTMLDIENIHAANDSLRSEIKQLHLGLDSLHKQIQTMNPSPALGITDSVKVIKQ